MERNRRTLRPSVAQTLILRKLSLAQAPFLTSMPLHQARHGHICPSKPRGNFSPSQTVPEFFSLWREGKSANPALLGLLVPHPDTFISSGVAVTHYSFSRHTSEGSSIFCQLRGRTALAYHHTSSNCRRVLQIPGCMKLQTEVPCNS